MPLVRIAYAGTADDAAKARLIAETTRVVTDVLAVPASAVNVLLTHVPPEDWGTAGVPLAEAFRARARAAGRPAAPRTARSVWVETGGLRLYALDFAGTAPALVIVPGITSPAETWRFAVDALDLPNRVVVLDNRGRGRSDAPASGYTRVDYADDIAAWIAALALVRPILLGHSMGARAVAAYGARVPESALIAVDPPMSGPGRPYPTPLDFYLDGMRAAAGGAGIEALRAASPGWSDARLRERVAWLPTCAAHAVAESHAHFTDEGFLDAWGQGTGPALFVHGGRSPVVLADDLAPVAAARPDASIVAVLDAGHMIPWDDLDGFVRAVRPFVQRISAGHEQAASSHLPRSGDR